MSRRWLWLTVLLVFGLAVIGVFLEPSGNLRGRLTGEPFLHSYPASYWGRQLQGAEDARAEALQSLEQAGSEALPVLEILLRSHTAAEVRWTAAELIGKLGPAGHPGVPAVLSAATDADPHVQVLAALALPHIEASPQEALPILIRQLSSSQAAAVARAISVYKGDAQPALQPLVELMKNEQQSTEARWNAARTLGKMGPAGLDSLPALIEYTKHPEDTLREHAAEAIGDIGPSAAEGIPALVECLDDPYVKVRRDAVRSLGYIGAVAREMVPQILPLLNDPEEIVRTAALNALQAIDPTSIPEKPEA